MIYATRKQRLIIIGLCFISTVVVFAVYPRIFPPVAGMDSLLILTALICVAGFMSAWLKKEDDL